MIQIEPPSSPHSPEDFERRNEQGVVLLRSSCDALMKIRYDEVGELDSLSLREERRRFPIAEELATYSGGPQGLGLS